MMLMIMILVLLMVIMVTSVDNNHNEKAQSANNILQTLNNISSSALLKFKSCSFLGISFFASFFPFLLLDLDTSLFSLNDLDIIMR